MDHSTQTPNKLPENLQIRINNILSLFISHTCVGQFDLTKNLELNSRNSVEIQELLCHSFMWDYIGENGHFGNYNVFF